MSINRDTADWGQFQPQRRNILINGDMRIWQRGTSFTDAANELAADRFKFRTNFITGRLDMLQSTDMPTGMVGNSLKFDVTTADAVVDAGDYYILDYNVEGYDMRQLAWGTSGAKDVVLSFWVKSPKSGTHCVVMKQNVNLHYINEYTVTAANTWEKITVKVPGPTTGTWLDDNGSGIYISWTLAMGSNFDSTAGAWTSGDEYKTTNQVNVMDNVANNFYITAVQLEVGEEATDFDYRPYAEELSMCQRYFQKAASTCLGYGYGTSVTTARIGVPLVVSMRDDPTITQSDGVLTNVQCIGRNVNPTVTAVVLLALTDTNVTMTITTTGLATNEGYQLYKGSGSFQFDAEL